MLTTFHIESALRNAAPNLKIGVLTAEVLNTAHNTELWETISRQIVSLEAEYEVSQINGIEQIAVQRSVYKALGKDPSRYRGSAEALLRRVLQGKELYQVNTIVDINNLISLKTLHPVGTYDLSRINKEITFRVGLPGETYKGIGKAEINIGNLPLFADRQGPFGSPTSDSERAMITLDTKRILMVIIAFTGDELTVALEEAKLLLETHAQAVEIETTIV